MNKRADDGIGPYEGVIPFSPVRAEARKPSPRGEGVGRRSPASRTTDEVSYRPAACEAGAS